VRRWLHDGYGSSWEKITTYFDAPLGEILTAIADATDAEPAGNYQALQLPKEQLETLLTTLPNWGRLRAVVRAPAGAVSELLLDGDQLSRKGDWLNCVTDTFHLHIHWSEVDHAFLARRGERSMGVHFLNKAGDLVCRLLLVREDEAFNANARSAFEQCWQAQTAQ